VKGPLSKVIYLAEDRPPEGTLPRSSMIMLTSSKLEKTKKGQITLVSNNIDSQRLNSQVIRERHFPSDDEKLSSNRFFNSNPKTGIERVRTASNCGDRVSSHCTILRIYYS